MVYQLLYSILLYKYQLNDLETTFQMSYNRNFTTLSFETCLLHEYRKKGFMKEKLNCSFASWIPATFSYSTDLIQPDCSLSSILNSTLPLFGRAISVHLNVERLLPNCQGRKTMPCDKHHIVFRSHGYFKVVCKKVWKIICQFCLCRFSLALSLDEKVLLKLMKYSCSF